MAFGESSEGIGAEGEAFYCGFVILTLDFDFLGEDGLG